MIHLDLAMCFYKHIAKMFETVICFIVVLTIVIVFEASLSCDKMGIFKA